MSIESYSSEADMNKYQNTNRLFINCWFLVCAINCRISSLSIVELKLELLELLEELPLTDYKVTTIRVYVGGQS